MVQAEVNIGTIGHVDHGKTTLTYALTGKWTDTHSEELKRGISIKLGYADATVYKCKKCGKYTTKSPCECGGEAIQQRKVSFVDSPGHETLMATVIAASSIVDGVLFVIAANEECPQPQTLEHLMILEAAGIKDVVIVQNKVDLVAKEQAKENHKQIKALLKGTPYEDAPIIPTAAKTSVNLSALLEAIEDRIKTPKRSEGTPLMYVVRSFDVNKPGTKISELKGGVIGGAMVKGVLKKGDEIEVLPGILKQKKGKEYYSPIKTRVLGLHAGNDALDEATPGGLIAVETSLDPSLARADSLVGAVAGPAGSLPQPASELTVEIAVMKRLSEVFPPSLTQNEPLVLGVGTNTTVGFVTGTKKKTVTLLLKKPVCANQGDRMAVMRRANNRWRLYGTAKIL